MMTLPLVDRPQNVKLPVNVPMPAEPGSAPPAPPKTLPHALSRAAKAGALNVGLEDRLGKTLNTYSEAMEKASLGSRPESCIRRA